MVYNLKNIGDEVLIDGDYCGREISESKLLSSMIEIVTMHHEPCPCVMEGEHAWHVLDQCLDL